MIQAIGAGMQAAGAIAGGIMKSRALKKQQRMLAKQQRENQEWFDRKYNEDATQRADAQRLLTMTQENIRQRNKQAAGSAAVMGGTEESVAAAKAANNQALTDTVSQIAASADARKDNIESQYLNKKESLDNQQMQLEQQKSEAINDAIQGVAGAAGSMFSMGGANSVVGKDGKLI